MRKRLYVAYGSNLNLEQMKHRCPTAKLIGTGVVNDYELQFKGFPSSAYATISPKAGASVPVGIWELGWMDEKYLDRYEGYPSHYFKKDIPVQMDNGEEVKGMVYIMNQKMQFGLPSGHYYQVVHQGYRDCGLDTHVLNEAVKASTGGYYENLVKDQEQQQGIRVPDEEYEDEEESYVDDEMEEEDFEDEDFDYSDGMHL